MLRRKTALRHAKTGRGQTSGPRAVLLAALVCWGLGGAAASPAQGLTDLGTLPGDVKSVAYGINRDGVVVGISYSSTGSTRAFVWWPDTDNGTSGTLTDLSGFLTPYESGAYGINNEGYIVGYFDAAVEIENQGPFAGPGGITYYRHAFMLKPDCCGGYTRYDLNCASPTSTGTAYDINNVSTESETIGKVVGVKDGTAVIWPDPTTCTGPTALITGGGSISSVARAINDDDVVVGWTDWPSDNTSPTSAFEWSGGSYTILSPNQHSTPTMYVSQAFGINNSDHIVGWIQNPVNSAIYAEDWNGTTSGVRIFPDSVLDNDPWGGAIDGKANAVNDSDRIVGYCNTGPGVSPSGAHAFVAVGGSITDLNTYLDANWQALVEATAINDYTHNGLAGQIVGAGKNAAGATHAFLLTP